LEKVKQRVSVYRECEGRSEKDKSCVLSIPSPNALHIYSKRRAQPTFMPMLHSHLLTPLTHHPLHSLVMNANERRKSGVLRVFKPQRKKKEE